MRTVVHEATLVLRNDLRLLWRDIWRRLAGAGDANRWRARLGFGLLAILLLAFQAALIIGFRAFHRPFPLHFEAGFWLLVSFLMLTSGVSYTVTVLFERADFDLLLSSPISPSAILLARMAGMTFAAALSVAAFAVPLLNAAAIGISARYLCGYVVWLLLALFITCFGVWLTLILVRWLGPRRARVWSQVVAALLGASFYIAFQSQSALSPESRLAVAKQVVGIFGHPLPAAIARAAHGELVPLATLVAAAALATFVTVRLLGRLFISGIQQSSAATRRARSRPPARFAEGLVRATFWKDVRLIVRDPLLLSRVLPSVFYLVPMLFPLQRMGAGGAPRLIASFAVLESLVLSTQLTAVTAAGEEGWDLIRLSPASTSTIRIAKIGAGMVLPFGLMLIGVIVVAALGRPWLALIALLTATIGSAASSWIEVAIMHPTPRNDLIKRNGRVRRPFSASRVLASIAFLGFGTATTVLAGAGLWWWAALTFGLVVLSAIACFTLIEMQDVEFEAAGRPKTHGAGAV